MRTVLLLVVALVAALGAGYAYAFRENDTVDVVPRIEATEMRID